MKVALISPRGAERNQQNDIIFDIYEELEGHLALMMDDIEFIPNLALLSLAAYLDPSWDLHFIEEDYIPEEKSPQVLFEPDFDLALISTVNYTALRGYQIADGMREKGIYTVIGGLHASALPEEAMAHCDTLVVGEGEDLLAQFVKDFLDGNPKKLYKTDKPVDLTTIPPTRYDLIDKPARYNKMPIIATRGCPHNCDFCIFPGVYGRKYRHKRVEQVVADIENIKKIHPRPFIHFCDENLLCDRDFSRELVKAITALNVPWECFCDIGIAEDEELLGLLKKSRCKDLLIGLETVDPAVMDGVDQWKRKKLEKYREYIYRIQSHRLPITGLFILGFDGDDSSVFRKVKDFITGAGLFDMDFAVLTPIPGSSLYYRLKKEGRIISENWSHYTWTHVNFQPMRMKADELQQGLLWLFREFSRMDMLERREGYEQTRRVSDR